MRYIEFRDNIILISAVVGISPISLITTMGSALEYKQYRFHLYCKGYTITIETGRYSSLEKEKAMKEFDPFKLDYFKFRGQVVAALKKRRWVLWPYRN